MKTTICFLAHGNPKTLIQTLESWGPKPDEIVIGDLMVLESDREYFHNHYKPMAHTRVIDLPFNNLFEYGFAYVMNKIASYAQYDTIIWMGVGNNLVEDRKVPTDANNCWGFLGEHNAHLYSCYYNRLQMKLDGRLHEEVVPIAGFEKKLDYEPHFVINDTPKLDGNAEIYNDIKEIVYLEQYRIMAEQPSERGITARYWVDMAVREYDQTIFKLRMKGQRYQAFKEGNLELYLMNVSKIGQFQDNEMVSFQ